MRFIAQYSGETREKKCSTHRRLTGGGLAVLPRRAISIYFYLTYLQGKITVLLKEIEKQLKLDDENNWNKTLNLSNFTKG